MEIQNYSYRFAKEILEHPAYIEVYREVSSVIRSCPIYLYDGKSKNSRLNVVQQLLNSYFDIEFSCHRDWEIHPSATEIESSDLRADFRRNYNNLKVHIEIQFGNMSRWYSDVFKFQTAYSTGLIDLGISIVPMKALADRIDSNVAYYERCLRELPSAKMSITLPILLIGIAPGTETPIFDLHNSTFPIKQITGNQLIRFKIINNLNRGLVLSDINAESPLGRVPNGPEDTEL